MLVKYRIPSPALPLSYSPDKLTTWKVKYCAHGRWNVEKSISSNLRRGCATTQREVVIAM